MLAESPDRIAIKASAYFISPLSTYFSVPSLNRIVPE